MAQAMREQINGNTPQDIMKVNENFEAIWYKLHGDVDFADTNRGLKNRIQTQYIPVQGEGNFDKNYPLYVRFYVPPNTKEIKSSSFNAICENYRMDSGVAEGGGGVEDVELNISMGGSNATITSASTSSNYFGEEEIVDGVNCIKSNSGRIARNINGGDIWQTQKDKGWYVPVMKPSYPTESLEFVEAFKDGYISLNDFYVRILTSKLQHSHNVSIAQSTHTHSGNGKLDLAPHTHQLKEGVKVSTNTPQNVVLHINDEPYAILDGSNPNSNGVDITQYIKLGEWNVIKVTTSNLARITIYGTIELILNY